MELTVTAARAEAQATGVAPRVRNDEATGVELTVTVARAEAQATGVGPRVRNARATGVGRRVATHSAYFSSNEFSPVRTVTR